MRLLKSTALAAALLVAFGASCGGKPSSLKVEAAPDAVDFNSDSQPLYAALQAELGYSFDALAVASAKFEARQASSCLSEFGYTVPEPDLERNNGLDARTIVEVVRDAVTGSSITSSQLNSVPSETLLECETQTESPVLELQNLLGLAIDEVSTRVQSRPEYVDAVSRAQQCPVRPEIGAATIDERAFSIQEEFFAGEVARTEALRALDQLEEDDAVYRSERDAECGSSVLEVERALVIEEQAAFLEREPEFLRSLADQYEDQLDELQEYL
jgi:chaperonin cofactor prefoldin